MNLLIDENLSPRLVQLLGEKGLPAQHVAHLGMAGLTDSEVWKYAFEHEQVVVTQNVEDFLYLAGSVELHPGLIVLRVGGLTREQQWQWLEPVVDELLASGESLINKVVEVTAVGRFKIRDLPPP
jgi:predicted nuclease of predicted toxin-antitoxin system